ncbi:MAG: DUF177 domain-containing protein [Rhodothalassiaceae bacterium]
MTPEYSHRVSLAELAEAPQQWRDSASETARGGLAQRFGLLALQRFDADVTAERVPSGDVCVSGRIRADVVQRCVVSGQPVPAQLDEAFDLRLTDAKTLAAWQSGQVDFGDQDVDLLEGDSIDLGELASQSLALCLDPYPRAPGAQMPQVDGVEQNQPARSSPFAALKRMKDT